MSTAKHQNQTGTALVVVLVILVILAAGGIGYWVWHRQHHPTPAKHTSSTTAASQSTAASKNTAATTTVKPCLSSDMALSEGSSDGTAGTIYKHAVITNNGKTSCTVAGYPSVFLSDAGGTVLGSSATDNPLFNPSAITLAAGGLAHVVVGFPEAGNFSDPNSCTAVSAGLQLYLPDDTTPLTTTWTDHNCPGFSVTVFQAGA